MAGAAKMMSIWGWGNEAKKQCYSLPFQLEVLPPTQHFQVLWGKERLHMWLGLLQTSPLTVFLVHWAWLLPLILAPFPVSMYSPVLPKWLSQSFSTLQTSTQSPISFAAFLLESPLSPVITHILRTDVLFFRAS